MSDRRNAVIRLALRSVTATFFLLGAVLLLSRHWTTLDWPATLGTVESVVVAPVGDGGPDDAPGEQFRPAVTYRYEVDGTAYTGRRVAVFDWVYRNRDRTAGYLQRHGIQMNARIPVYYDPEEPERSIVVRELPLRRLEVILGVLLLVVLPVAVIVFSIVDLFRDGGSRRDDRSRGRLW